MARFRGPSWDEVQAANALRSQAQHSLSVRHPLPILAHHPRMLQQQPHKIRLQVLLAPEVGSPLLACARDLVREGLVRAAPGAVAAEEEEGVVEVGEVDLGGGGCQKWGGTDIG